MPLTSGDTFVLTVAPAGYPAGDGWVGKLRLVPRASGGTAIDLTAAADGDAHVFTAAASVTAGWAAGEYTQVLWMELGAVKQTIETSQLSVLPDPRTMTAGTDTRSLARRTLDDLLTARASWAATQGRTRRYKIGEREREFATAAELDREIAFWTNQLAQEDAAARLAQGLRPKNRILTRFVRPR